MLVTFYRKDIISFVFYNLFCNIGLCADCIDGDDTAFNIQQPQKLWNCGNLITFLIDLDLTQNQLIIRSPSAYHVDRALSMKAVFGASDTLPVNTNHLLFYTVILYFFDPFHKEFLKNFGTEIRKDPINRIVRGYPVWQFQECAKKVYLRFTKLFDRIP